MANGNNTPDALPRTSKRRGLLSGAARLGAATALAAGFMAPAARAIGADAELLAFCAAWRRAVDRFIPIVSHVGNFHEKDQSTADRALLEDAQDEVYGLEERIFSTEATSLAGLKAKAEVLDYMEAAMDVSATAEQAASLVADIKALGAAW